MRLRPEQLAAHLRKTLAPLYLVYGEEPLQAQEAADAIRVAAREKGYRERQCLSIETGFDWNTLRQQAASLSLFATQRLLEWRLGNVKLGDAGTKALMDYAERPASDAVLLIIAGKLDWNTQKTRWFAALDHAGVVIPSLPLEWRQLPGWIEKRLQARGLNPTAEAVALISERVEGNLLAAAQEIEKLALLTPAEQLLTAEAIFAAVSDSSRYSLYDLVDAALLGQPGRTVRILNGLRSEGVEPVLINWVLHQEIRILTALAFARDRHQPLDATFTAYKVWEKRKPSLNQALQRLALADCQRLLRACADIDQRIKGAKTGSPWDALLENCLRLAGLCLLPDPVL